MIYAIGMALALIITYLVDKWYENHFMQGLKLHTIFIMTCLSWITVGVALLVLLTILLSLAVFQRKINDT